MATIPEALNTALQHHQAGRLQEAEALYRQILQAQPEHPDALHLLGVIAHHVGRHQIAVDLIGKAIALNPAVAEYHNNLGEACRALGKSQEATASYGRALALKPDFAEAHYNLGILLKGQGKRDEAIGRFRRALAVNPSYVEALNNLGSALLEQGKAEEAVACYQRALTIKPDFVFAHNNLGNALAGQSRLVEAVAHFRQALLLQPACAEAYNNLGNALKSQGDLAEAEASYRQALVVKPMYAEAYNNLGNVLREKGNWEEAVASYRQALTVKPMYAEAYYHLSVVLGEQGSPEEAVRQCERALSLNPNFVEAENQLMYLSQQLCEWSRFEELVERQKQRIQHSPASHIAPFTMLCVPCSPAEQLACARNWVANRLSGVVASRDRLGFRFTRTPKPRLRLGYLSTDFREHPVAHLIAELFELHDRTAFEVCGYSYGPDDGGAMRARIVRACDRFVDVRGASFERAAGRIYEDRVDIVIDLTGYTKGARTEILALRPAPIQVNWLGYPSTMGAEFMDYIITDRFISPPDHEPYYAERFVYLPDCYQVNDRKRAIAKKTPTKRECELPDRGFVFCCFNNTNKIAALVFDVWMRLLKEIPGSVLWLLEANSGAAANLRREAKARKIAPDRLVFAPKMPPDQHLARQRLADLFLDTLPYNAHVTASDALWVGLPVLTCSGETFASRVAGSLLRAIGLPELVTTSLAEYEAAAIRLAGNPAELKALRDRLAKNRLTTPLFDSERFARHLECAYQMMWDRYARGEAPRPIEVPI